MTDLAALDQEIGRLISALEPAQRRKVLRQIAIELRRENSERIANQRNPDGSPYTPRKQRPTVRGKAGRIKAKERLRKMFRRLRLAQWLRAESTADEAAAGFTNTAVARVARVHQEGLRDKVDRHSNAPEAHYPSRKLLSTTEESERRIVDAVMRVLDR